MKNPLCWKLREYESFSIISEAGVNPILLFLVLFRIQIGFLLLDMIFG
jgi:hypothetical protein